MIELLVSMVVVAILMGVLIPAMHRARSSARRTQCLNNIRNIALAISMQTDSERRFPACGYFGKSGGQRGWVVDLLPWIDQKTVYNLWNIEKSLSDPENLPVADSPIPLIACPDDISVVKAHGNLSYVVNGGVGFTVRWTDGTHDCPVDPSHNRMDLNANGVMCPPDPMADGTPSDKDLFLKMGLFFNETWKWDVTVRHHQFSTVVDGLSQTIMLSENVRTGYDPLIATHNWASNNPYLTSFYIGNPCGSGPCSRGGVDYGRANAGSNAINSGLRQPEGSSPRPNSFHVGGVNVVFCDGHVKFLSELVDGGVYAALVSPQGVELGSSPLAQLLLSGEDY